MPTAHSKLLPFIVPLTLALTISACSNEVRIDSRGIDLSTVRVMLDNNDISASFQTTPDGHSLQGLVENLAVGENTLQAMQGSGITKSQTTLINHPITGPVISGPHIQPFV